MKNYLTHPLLKFAWLAQCSCRLYYFGLSLSFSGEPWLFLLMSSENFLMSFLVCYAGSTDDFVYDFYAMKDMMDMAHADASNPFPLIKVHEEDFYNEPDESEYESDDSNAENNPLNDYPDETSEEEDDLGVENEPSENEMEENGSGRCKNLQDHGVSDDA